MEEKTVTDAGHERVIVNLDDDVYGIHGLYISDPTRDNNKDHNYLNNAILTFDKMQVDNRMFWYRTYNPILDIHNFQEFNEQVNFLLTRELKENQKNSTYKDYPFSKIIQMTYSYVASRLLESMKCDPKYLEFLQIKNSCKEEKDFVDFFTKLGNYLLTRINKPIDSEIILKANSNVLKELNLAPKENEINEYYERDIKQFPYSIPDDNDFNLEDRKKSR